MEEQIVRAAIDRHWAASAAGDRVTEHEITTTPYAPTRSQVRSSMGGRTCKHYEAITQASLQGLLSGES